MCHWHLWNYVDIYLKSYRALSCKQSSWGSKEPDYLRTETKQVISRSCCSACSLFQRRTTISLSLDSNQEKFQLPSLCQLGDWKLTEKEKNPLFFSFEFCFSLITACKAVFVPWHYDHIHFRSISENGWDYLFSSAITYKWVYITHSEYMLCCV